MNEIDKKKQAREKKEQEKIDKDMRLATLLDEGWSSNGFDFNERNSYKFCTLMNTAINLEFKGMQWKRADGTTAVIPIETAKTMAIEMITELSKLHNL